MSLNILKDEKDKLVLDLGNEYSTMAAALKSELWKDSKLKVASFNKKHTLIGGGELIVEGQNPKALVRSSIDKIRKDIDKFKKSFLKGI